MEAAQMNEHTKPALRQQITERALRCVAELKQETIDATVLSCLKPPTNWGPAEGGREMSKVDGIPDETFLDYAEELFAYLQKLGWESPDQKRITELEKLLELWMLYYTDGLPDDDLRELYCDSVDTQREQT
jgi:hypothetical protein